jgi:hypothetical protein
MSSLIRVVLEIHSKLLSKRQNGTVDPSLFSLHLIEGKVIPDWKKFISSGENIIRFLGDYIAKHILHNDATLNVILLIQFARIQCMQNYAGIRLFLCACQTTAIEHTILIQHFNCFRIRK